MIPRQPVLHIFRNFKLYKHRGFLLEKKILRTCSNELDILQILEQVMDFMLLFYCIEVNWMVGHRRWSDNAVAVSKIYLFIKYSSKNFNSFNFKNQQRTHKLMMDCFHSLQSSI